MIQQVKTQQVHYRLLYYLLEAVQNLREKFEPHESL